tara:strand:- start:3939 stop:4064 length:126 start_codon:yes stop_codon:yes gene_type:complete
MGSISIHAVLTVMSSLAAVFMVDAYAMVTILLMGKKCVEIG